MKVLAMTVPVPPGKVSALEAHIEEAQEHKDLNKTLGGFGIEHESWHIEETPQGTQLILVFQCEDPPAMLEAFGKSDAPLPLMQKQFLKETLGIDLSQPPPAPPPRVIFEWP